MVVVVFGRGELGGEILQNNFLLIAIESPVGDFCFKNM